MSDKMINNIIKTIWAILLFSAWIILSHLQGLGGEWWSLYNINPEKSGLWALEISFLKIAIFAFLSIIGGFVIFEYFEKRFK